MAAKKKNVAHGNIEVRLAALRADFGALQADMKGLYGDVSEVASERAALAMKSAEEIADRAVALAEEAAKEAKSAALEYKDEAEEWAEANADELSSVWAPFARSESAAGDQPSGQADIKSEIGQVVSAVWQLATQGSDQQKRAALDVLVDTRRRLYGILADGRGSDR